VAVPVTEGMETMFVKRLQLTPVLLDFAAAVARHRAEAYRPTMRLRFMPVLLAAVGVLAASCSTGSTPAPASSSAATGATRATRATGSATAAGAGAAGGDCSAAPPVSPLPTWARSGFHPPDTPMPHVLGKNGNIIAILWARKNALHAPPLPSVSNKILWVSKAPLVPLSPLKIHAILAGSGRTVNTYVTGGPGPSIIDLPAAGCWTLDLSWSGHTDQVRLRYVAG